MTSVPTIRLTEQANWMTTSTLRKNSIAPANGQAAPEDLQRIEGGEEQRGVDAGCQHA
jgi:hypothetical protein